MQWDLVLLQKKKRLFIFCVYLDEKVVLEEQKRKCSGKLQLWRKYCFFIVTINIYANIEKVVCFLALFLLRESSRRCVNISLLSFDKDFNYFWILFSLEFSKVLWLIKAKKYEGETCNYRSNITHAHSHTYARTHTNYHIKSYLNLRHAKS